MQKEISPALPSLGLCLDARGYYSRRFHVQSFGHVFQVVLIKLYGQMNQFEIFNIFPIRSIIIRYTLLTCNDTCKYFELNNCSCNDTCYSRVTTRVTTTVRDPLLTYIKYNMCAQKTRVNNKHNIYEGEE